MYSEHRKELIVENFSNSKQLLLRPTGLAKHADLSDSRLPQNYFRPRHKLTQSDMSLLYHADIIGSISDRSGHRIRLAGLDKPHNLGNDNAILPTANIFFNLMGVFMPIQEYFLYGENISQNYGE